MRNDVKGMDGAHSIVFVLPKALDHINNANLNAPSDESVRQIIKSIKNATTDYRSRFLDTPKKICCVRVPRSAFNGDLLKELDTGKSCNLC